MGEGKIIVVANQKGGVGKSTICMSLSNYLANEMKFNIGGIIDTDFQQSISRRRKIDKERNEGTSNIPSYEVTSFNLDNYSIFATFIGIVCSIVFIFSIPRVGSIIRE